MRFTTKKKLKNIIFITILSIIIYLSGILTHFLEKNFENEFNYPYNVNMEKLLNEWKTNQTPHIKPINLYPLKFSKNPPKKCLMDDNQQIRLVFLIKSAPKNFDRRIAIRSSWGYEKRFSDVEIRTVFLLGAFKDEDLGKALRNESQRFGDVVQGNFTDNYENNTWKTMMGFTWAVKYCLNSKFFMFVDDDYYVSTKNVLRFIRNPINYPDYLNFHRKLMELDDNVRLYAGYAFKSAPQRHLTSKWYISLGEYPYDMWPPYITAGAYILSRQTLYEMFITSFYTKHFKFDDIYVALLAFKIGIEPLHSNEFYFYPKTYSINSYKYTIASHGYDKPIKLMKIWTEQKIYGNA